MGRNKEIEKIKLQIPDYVSGLLGDEDKKLVEQNLSKSAELKDFYDEIKSAFSAVDRIKYTEPSPGYWINLLPRIHQRIDEKEEAALVRNPFAIWWKVLVPVAAVILIVIIYMLSTSTKQQMTKEEKKEQIQQVEQQKQEIPQPQKNITADEKQIPVKKDMLKKMKTKHEAVIPENEHNVAEKTVKDNVKYIKNELLIKDISEEFASKELGESLIFGEAGSYDEEIESQLDKLSTTEQDLMLEKLLNSDL